MLEDAAVRCHTVGMTPEQDDDLSGWAWGDTFKNVTHIPYVPNPPKQHSIYRRVESIPLTEPLQPAESYDWKSVTAKTYIHVIRCEGYFHYRRNEQLPRYFAGFETKDFIPDEKTKKRGLRNNLAFYGKGGVFYLQWGWQHWFRPYGSCDLRLILCPTFRESPWKSLDWANPIIHAVAKRYSQNGLRMRYIEIAVDLFGEFKHDGLAQCLWRGWAAPSHIPHGIDTTTVYDGRKKSSRKDIVYFKEGASHFEARWEGTGLRMRGAVVPSTATILSLLLEMCRNMRFLYIDWNKILRSPSVMERAPGCWNLFLAKGIVATIKQMRLLGINNPEDKTSTHPIDTPFRKALAKSIAEGIQRLQTDGANIGGATAAQVRRKWADKAFIIELASHVERLARAEYQQLEPLQSRRPRAESSKSPPLSIRPD